MKKQLAWPTAAQSPRPRNQGACLVTIDRIFRKNFVIGCSSRRSLIAFVAACPAAVERLTYIRRSTCRNTNTFSTFQYLVGRNNYGDIFGTCILTGKALVDNRYYTFLGKD